MTCAEDQEGCAEQGIHWDGCAAEQVECGRKGFCAANASMCVLLGGCGTGKMCGVHRNRDGRVVLDNTTGLPKPICKERCEGELSRCERTEGRLGDNRGPGELVGRSEGGKVVVVLATKSAGALTRADNSSAGVNFTITPAPDSLVRYGAFRRFFETGTLVSAARTAGRGPLGRGMCVGSAVLGAPSI